MRKFYFNIKSGQCEPFVYGGCGGNSNNYATWTECSSLCGYPTVDSKWWEWGADWWRWNAQLNETSGSGGMRANASRAYSRDDFMRDWMLWGLLTEGEGEIEMETMATLIAQAHILGFGKATGSSGTAAWGSGSNAAQSNAYSLADTKAALGYFQQMFGGSEAESSVGGAYGFGAQNYGMPRPGSFTPLGEMGSEGNMLNFGSGMFESNGWDSNGGRYINGLNQPGVGQFGRGSQPGGGQAIYRNKGTKASAGETNWHEARGQSRSLNTGNTRQGWAPHGESVLPPWLTSGQTGTSSSGGGAALDILRMIVQLSMGNLKSSDLVGLAKRFGAVHSNGKVNLQLLAQRMVNSLSGPTGNAQLAQLKGIAKSLGAVDASGKINVNMLLNEMAASLGRGGLTAGLGTGSSGKGQFGVGQGMSASGAVTMGGGSRKRKTYNGKK